MDVDGGNAKFMDRGAMTDVEDGKDRPIPETLAAPSARRGISARAGPAAVSAAAYHAGTLCYTRRGIARLFF